MNRERLNRFPLQPVNEATAECLSRRLDEIYKHLAYRHFSDTVISFAVDEVAEVGSKALQRGKAQTMSPSHRAAWIWTVALKAAKRYASKELPSVSLAKINDMASHVPDDAVHSPVLLVLIEELERLPEGLRNILELCDMEGRSLREAATDLGITAAGICRRRVKARESLRRAIIARLPESLLMAGI